tara:strand:- start:143439 stop:143735 length:297 start_codon:yes stop_codon:yes gene_type:complete
VIPFAKCKRHCHPIQSSGQKSTLAYGCLKPVDRVGELFITDVSDAIPYQCKIHALVTAIVQKTPVPPQAIKMLTMPLFETMDQPDCIHGTITVKLLRL